MTDHPWLDIPDDWQLERLKVVLRERGGRSSDGSEVLLGVSEYTGVVPRASLISDGDFLTRTESLEGYKKCSRGDVVVNIMLAWKTGLGIAGQDGIVSPAYSVFSFTDAVCHPPYFGYLLRCSAAVDYYRKWSYGVVPSRLRIYPSTFLSLRMPIPPFETQRAIAAFLDEKTARIDDLIAKKERLIELLQEKRTALITRAVTKGLDPDVTMKDSGVEWLGEVPAHWDVVSLKHLVELVTGFPFPSEGFTAEEEDVRLLRGVNVAPGKLRWDDVAHWPRADADAYRDFWVREGDIILGMDRPLVGAGTRVAMVEASDLPAILLQRVARLRPLEGLLTRYLYLAISSQAFADYLAPIFTGISVPHLSPAQIGAFKIALPPVDEQALALELTDDALGMVSTLTAKVTEVIDRLREYRTALISAAVTGKIDVRESA